MKTPPLAIGLMTIVFGLVVTFVPSSFAQAKPCEISVQFKRVVIPVTKLTPADEKALYGILEKYNKSLYKIVKFENGEKVAGSERGLLKDTYICEEAAITKAAKENGQSGEGIQVGGIKCTPACSHLFHDEDLVAKVEKLLMNYCR